MRNKLLLSLFVLLSLSYVLITYFTPVEQSALVKYSLTLTQARLLQLTITIPVVIIWFVAFFAWRKIAAYAVSVKDTKEGIPLRSISIGLLFLVLWLPITASLGAYFRSIYVDNTNLTAPLTILSNYINLAILITALIFLVRGAYGLKGLVKERKDWRWTNLAMLIVGLLSFLYIYVTLANPYRTEASGNVMAAYYLPDWLLVFSIILPYLVVFYLGLRTVQYMHVYKLSAHGILYRQAVSYIANGIGVTLLGVLAIRYTVSMTSAFNSAGLKAALGVIYGLVIVIAVGFVLIAKGANRLKRIEEL